MSIHTLSLNTEHRTLNTCRLYTFIDTAYLRRRDPLQTMRQLIAGGADIVQLRDPALRGGDLRATLDLARHLARIARAANVLFIVNDSVEIARLSGAHGVHLGQEDLQRTSVTAARHILGARAIVGISTHSLAQAIDAERRCADYIGVGPVFPTATKPKAKPVGLKLVTQVAEKTRLPFFAIGGVTRKNAPKVFIAGARGIAVVSDILCAADVADATRDLKRHCSCASVERR
jgi:thiamine-phosphate pyrophosphorylase